MEHQKHRLLRYLNDSYAAEIGGLESLKDLIAVSSDEQVKQAAKDHLALTQSQADRLAARIKALGGDKSEPKAVVNTLIAKGSALVNIGHDHEDKQTQDLIKTYSFEHFEIGAYTSLYAYASAIGDYETAALAQEIRAEEEQAAIRFERLIPQVAVLAVNKTTQYAPVEKKKSGSFALSPWVLVPGAALAFWGVSRLLSANSSNGNNGSNNQHDYNFGTARQPNTESSRLSPDVSEAVVVVDEIDIVEVAPVASTSSYDLNSETRPVTPSSTPTNSGSYASSSSTSSSDFRSSGI